VVLSKGAVEMAAEKIVLLALSLLYFAVAEGRAWEAPSPPNYTELYIEQEVDHFNYEIQDTFMARYLLAGELSAATAVRSCM